MSDQSAVRYERIGESDSDMDNSRAVNVNNPEIDSSDDGRAVHDTSGLIAAPKQWFPQRYVMAVLSMLGFVNVYGMRVNLSVAIVSMVENRTRTGENGTVHHYQEFKWDSVQQGFILSSFFWGYIFTQIPGGLLASRYGGKKVFGLGILSTAVFTLLTPVTATYGGYHAFIILRIMEGFCEGVTFPAMHSFWSKWAPKLELTRLVSISLSGTYFGTVIAMPVSGLLGQNVNWQSIFYVFGCVGIIWYVTWVYIAAETPEEYSFISKEELIYIKLTRGANGRYIHFKDVPWKKIFTSMPVMAIVVAHFSENWGFYTMLTELPSYMKDVLHFNLENSGFLSAIPYLTMTIIILFSGQLADFLRRKKYLSTTAVRKLFNTVGFLGQMTFMLLAGHATSTVQAIVFLAFAVGMDGFAVSGYNVNHLDISPKYAGILMGITNTAATIPGIVTPVFKGAVVVHKTAAEWRIIFYVSAIIYACGAVFYGIFSSGNIQSWNN
ncbi:Uncharacterised protein g3683 [Pycnogonum litorale]